MDCRCVQDRLLQAEDPGTVLGGTDEVARHVETCAECRDLARRLSRLEQQWRALPLPPESDAARDALLERIRSKAQPAVLVVSARGPSRRRFLRWLGAAAAGTAAAGAAAWLVLGGSHAEADDDLLDSLLDWNLRLAALESAEERADLFGAEAPRWQTALSVSRLSEEHRTLAEGLLENGAWLAAHRNPLEEAERFDGLAERLLGLAEAAGHKRHFRRMERLLEQYARVVESGVDPNVERAERSGTLNFQHQRRLERLLLQDAKRLKKLTALLDRSPNASRKQIRKAMGAGKQGKHPAHGK